MVVRIAMLCLALAFSVGAPAKTFRWASQGDAATQDPHGQDEGFTRGINQMVYERLLQPGKDGALVATLATAWKNVSPTKMVFTLRKGVKWQDGTPFTADDVVFSFERAAKSRQFRAYAIPAGEPKRIDDHTVEFTTPSPNPVALVYASEVPIMSRKWAEKNKVTVAQDFAAKENTFASLNAMGTGPYKLVSWEPGVKTVHVKNPNWWGIKEKRFESNADTIEYRPIQATATRMAALLSGEIDFVLDPAVQDMPRLKELKNLRVWEGDETRIILIAMDQARDELLFSDVKGKNPLKDKRVRQALYQAIDIQSLKSQIMRGYSTPTGIPTPDPKGEGIPAALEKRIPYNNTEAKKLLTDAGYPNGFGFTLHCPNDRYLNDERICLALANMWARVGLTVQVEAMPKAQYFQRTPKKEFSVCMQGWGSNNRDAIFTLRPILHSMQPNGAGDTNYGNFKNEELDDLIDKAEVEMDPARRQELINKSIEVLQRDINIIPLHRQVVPWVSREGVSVVHRSDNRLILNWVKVP
jgi:peptide/nickel transport system substrate-binding protein